MFFLYMDIDLTVIYKEVKCNDMFPKIKWDQIRKRGGGDKIEPCGTPDNRRAEENRWSPRLTQKDGSTKQDLNHFSAVTVMPTYRSKVESKIGSTVLNAAVKCKISRSAA